MVGSRFRNVRRSSSLSLIYSAFSRSFASYSPLHTDSLGSSAILGLPKLEPSSDAESLSQILLTHHNPFHCMESSLQLLGVSLCPQLLHQTLLRLHHNSKIALALFRYSLSLPSPPPTTTSFNILIDILGKVRQFDVAWQLIVQMDTNGVKINAQTFLILIKRLIAAGLTRQALRAFDDAPCFIDGEEHYPRSFSLEEFCCLLDTLSKYGYVKLAVEVFNKRRHEFGSDAKIYTVLIYGWCKIRRIDMAEKFLKEMLDKKIEPNVITYNVLLNGVCRTASLHPEVRFERTVRNAERLFAEMRQRGIEPDVTSFSILLHVYCRAHKPELILDKLEIMKEKGINPSLATYTSVIKCLCSCGRLEDAEELICEMAENGINPSPTTFNCFFKEYRGRKDVDGALSLYRRMKSRQNGLCKPDLHTYNILLNMFVKMDKMGIVNEVWDDLRASDTGPDLDSYTLLIHGLCEKKKWGEACKLFVEMIEKGFLPQKITFESLYRGLIQADMLRTWRRLKKRLDEESIVFGTEFHNYHFKPYRR